jgi:uncharacterized membrane protein
MTMDHRFSLQARDVMARYKSRNHAFKVSVVERAWMVKILKGGLNELSHTASGTGTTAEDAFCNAYYVFGMNTGEW